MTYRFTPDHFIDHVCRTEGVTREALTIADTVVITWFDHVFSRLVDAADATIPQPTAFGRALQTGEIEGRPVSIVRSPIGAPATIALMEELIACGAKTIIGFGYAGSLQQNAPIGSILIPTTCVSDEGTSKHYLEDPSRASGNAKLVSLLQNACETSGLTVRVGRHWTVDAIYRERIDHVEMHAAAGVLGVDMETSAMYTLGYVRDVRVCNVLVVSDELWTQWNPGFGGAALHEAKTALEDVLIRTIPIL